ncbi:MAG TPA: enoyl-CoA hydratase family protein [Candidatus Thermoplasmatota archaeon]|nr:enoyl-CoA hydratase family protein [Candidatus Thermoplasmatota archaeon]
MVEGLRYQEDGKVATITLSRPDRLNALTFDIYAELRDTFARLRHNANVQAVVLTGEGRGFCSGGDVEDIIGHLLKMEPAQLLAFTTMTCDVVANMRACPQPIVAALNGTVAGAGSALALASDFRLAAPEAKIAFLFVKAGLSAADMGACHLLPRIVGLGRATELLMLGDFIGADEAHRIGLYNRIVPRESLLAEARALAERLASGPGVGIAVSKETLNAQLDMSIADALRWDAHVQAQCMLSPDFREAYEAFRDKRPAKYAPRVRR